MGNTNMRDRSQLVCARSSVRLLNTCARGYA